MDLRRKPVRLLGFLFGGGLIGLGLGMVLFSGPSPTEDTGANAAVGSLEARASGPLEGAEAPDFKLSSLDGDLVRLSDYRGDIVLLSFWATWCEPCTAEMPLFEERYRALRSRGLVVLAVNFDEPEDAVRAFRDRFNLSFPVLLDPGGSVQNLYRVRGYPTTILIDREGLIRVVHVGIMDDTQLDEYLVQVGLQA